MAGRRSQVPSPCRGFLRAACRRDRPTAHQLPRRLAGGMRSLAPEFPDQSPMPAAACRGGRVRRARVPQAALQRSRTCAATWRTRTRYATVRRQQRQGAQRKPARLIERRWDQEFERRQCWPEPCRCWQRSRGTHSRRIQIGEVGGASRARVLPWLARTELIAKAHALGNRQAQRGVADLHVARLDR